MLASKILELKLQNFRSFEDYAVSFHSDQTLVLGNNGKGKTNILESISLLSTGRSFQGKSLSECVRLGTQVAHITAKGLVEDEEVALALSIVGKENNLGERASTRYQKNGVKKRKSDVVSLLKSVVFRPEDLELIIGTPSHKRHFLDEVLLQVSKKYSLALREYEKALKHRNKLILQLREGLANRRDFLFWDEILIRHGDTITRERASFLSFLNTSVSFPLKASAIYDRSLMTEERLHKYASAEVAAGKTLVGPHKDLFSIEVALNGDGKLHDVSLYGSRGQQRLAVLWLKLGQLAYIERETNLAPILLLDDIFSELDDPNREIIFPLFADHQVIMTSAEQIEVLPIESKKGKIINL
jgi:DNA replication and repair protein RecF